MLLRITSTSRSWPSPGWTSAPCTGRGWSSERSGSVDLPDWSGILLGGGPFNSSDPEELKSPVQRRVEADLRRLLDRVISADFPFLGACYGIGTLGSHQGAVIDRRHAEPVSPVPVTLTGEGRQDPLLRGLPATFDAFIGHKEAISLLPHHAVLLASSPACPVQAFRIGSHVYATQFHPELDVAGLCTRIDVYKHAGYFEPGASRRTQGNGPPQQRHPPARHPPPVRPALRTRRGRPLSRPPSRPPP